MHQRLQPERGTARQLFDLLEGARCEGMGMRIWRGAAENVDAACALRLHRALDRQRRLGVTAEAEEFSLPVLEAFAALVRAKVSGRAVPEPFAEGANTLASRLGEELLERLTNTANNQAEFAKVARAAMEFLRVPGTERERAAREERESKEHQAEGDERMSDLTEEWDITEDDPRTHPTRPRNSGQPKK